MTPRSISGKRAISVAFSNNMYVGSWAMFPRDIPNFSATIGKSPRSTIAKDKFLFEYVIESSAKHRLARMQEVEDEERNSTSQNLDVLPSFSTVSNCSGVNLLAAPKN